MNGHPTREEDFDLYALGVVEGDEKQALESHLAACSECARMFAAAKGRMALLAFAAPRVEPSPGVKERLMRQLHSTAEGRAYSPARIEPESMGGGFFGRWWAAVLAPAALALALATIFLWVQNNRLHDEDQRLQYALHTQQNQIDELRHIADVIQAHDTVSVLLRAMPGMGQGTAQVLYNSGMGELVYDGWISPPPPDKSYQLWMVPMNGNPISVGVFNPVTSDSSTWMAKMPQGVTAKAFAVTLEPAGGMPHPTGPQVLVGPAS
jgi:anti-sigma-K factor RskA